ncbi:MAG: PilC/PilY family type IV pilus protein [Candidatus Thiodiazotropha sp.]
MNTYRRILSTHKRTILGLLIGITYAHSLLADDVAIYLTEPPDPVPPNVLFVLDESGSMSSNSPSRRDQLVSAMKDIVNDPDMGNVNAALLGYTTNTGNNGPLYLNARTGNFKIIEDNRSAFLNQINRLMTHSYTPTVKALEAAVDWFRNDRTFIDFSNNTMTSPIAGRPEDNKCKPNHIVLLSDGEPNSNTPPSRWRPNYYGLTTYQGTNCASDTTSINQNGRCAREIASWAFNTDLETGTGWEGTQRIITHTIGFETNSSTRRFLTSIATAGGGSFYPAANATDLVSAFQTILTDAQQSIPYTYTAPVIPFNQDNAAVSGNRIYVPMFVPTGTQLWEGNLKSYTISTDTTTSNIVLSDANGDSIIDTNYEFVSSQDHWSTSLDGGDPLVNGAAAHMGESNVSRRLYSNLDGETPHLPLSNSANLVSTTTLAPEDLGVATDDERTELVNWITWNWTAPTPPSGEDPAPSREGSMGAPIHTHPAVVRYGSDKVIYLPTSEGVLEAIDASTGRELWAFMPKDLLPNISLIKTNTESSVPYYGLDGPLTIYKVGTKTMAIVGMRRGGKSYYMLDISNKDAPVFITQITDPNPSTANDAFDGLGQTWSKAIHATMFVGSEISDVLIFGGGYDTDQDSATTRANDDEGNAIFVVKASDGTLLQKLSNSITGVTGMNNAIAADVIPFDMDRNGIVDRIYAADVGGRIIRLDIPENAAGSISGGVVADINGTGATAFRRFFNTPEIGYYNRNGVQYLAIMIGSGNRPNPLDVSVTDRFYMFKDPQVWAAPTSYQAVTESVLYDATDNLLQDGNTAEQATANSELTAAKGWFLDYGTSEKSFSEAVLYNYAVLFTTFSANRNGILADCEARGATGVSRFYAVNMVNGTAMFSDLGGNAATLTGGDRSTVLSMIGIPPTPSLVFPEGDTGMLGKSVKAMVGLEEVTEWPNQLIPIWWEEVISE